MRNNCLSFAQPAVTVYKHSTYSHLLHQGGFSEHFETCIKTVLDLGFEKALGNFLLPAVTFFSKSRNCMADRWVISEFQHASFILVSNKPEKSALVWGAIVTLCISLCDFRFVHSTPLPFVFPTSDQMS